MAGLCATSDPIVGNNLDGARVQSGQGKERGLEGDQPTASHLSEPQDKQRIFPFYLRSYWRGWALGVNWQKLSEGSRYAEGAETPEQAGRRCWIEFRVWWVGMKRADVGRGPLVQQRKGALAQF